MKEEVKKRNLRYNFYFLLFLGGGDVLVLGIRVMEVRSSMAYALPIGGPRGFAYVKITHHLPQVGIFNCSDKRSALAETAERKDRKREQEMNSITKKLGERDLEAGGSR